MKQKLLYIVIMAGLVFTGQSFQKKENAKRIALIVAIGDYKPGTNWSHLSSMADDTIITAALLKQGFLKSNILHVSNEAATLDGIRKKFAELEKATSKGDVVYIHFSSHGQQIWETGTKEEIDEIDGYDEAIVPWDAPSKYYPGYKGEKHLKDDELGKLVNRIRAKAGPTGDVLVVVDACHSGTTLRGDVTRGNAKPMAPDDYNPIDVKPTEDASAVDDFMVSNEAMSPVVLFSASRAHEPNQEYKGFGSLSLALTQSFNRIKQGDSYRTLFAYVNAEMTNMQLNQVPVLEGSADRALFGGNEVKQSNYYPISHVHSYSATIEGGTLAGLYVGSKVAFMPAGSTSYNPEKAVFTTTITSADMTKSFVMHSGELKAYTGNAKQLWLFVVEQTFGNNKLKVGSGENLSGKFKNEVKDNVTKLKFIEWDDKNFDVYIDFSEMQYGLYLPNGTLLFDKSRTKEVLNVQLSAYMQGKIMREANFYDKDINVELEFTPKFFAGRDEEGNALIFDVEKSQKLINGVWEINENDVMFLTLTNKGNMDVYINILEISPSGTVNVVLPDYENNENAFDFLIPKGKTIAVESFARRLGPQKGKYVFKVFATEKPVSFRNIFNTRGTTDDVEYVHPAAELFQYTYRTRSENLSVKKTSGGGTTKEYVIRLN